MFDDLRKAIAVHESRLAKVQRQSRRSDADTLHTQDLLEMTLDSLRDTLQKMEKSQKAIATSQALLEWSTIKGVELSNRPRTPPR
jgi:hypothetical protein